MHILSIEFFLFFFIFWLVYLLGKFQNTLLTAASLFLLYYADPNFALTVLVYSAMIYFIARGIVSTSSQNIRKFFLGLGIITAISVLAIFKYFDFFKIFLIKFGLNEEMDFLMPLGLSYYVFQSIAYLVSLYEDKNNDLNFHETLLHFSFFPTITAGPILRVNGFKTKFGEQQGFLQQVRSKRHMIRPALACSLILLGIAKKWWFAGDIANYVVNPVFENPLEYHSIDILAAIYGYTLQLFFDFSGYSDLVIGIAMLLGFQLPINFKMPLRAVNIQDFWNRWHISLSTWIRDYIYIPLGGNRVNFFKKQLNLFLAFFLSGIWHGVSLNFAIWGALHGVALVFQNLVNKIFRTHKNFAYPTTRLGKFIGIVLTFNFVSFTFLVFKTTELNDFTLMIYALFHNFYSGILNSYALFFLGFIVFLLVFYPVIEETFDAFVSFLEFIPKVFWILIFTLLLIIITYFSPAGIPGFIYAGF
ncbi:MBOAT family O-acyltransferase [Actinobacillus delphinicola]|uniref:Probable alginate O-acetylase n=1 Tax=Actinobacillus delphinicola TaxID=51161 RepID=A0A448TSN8_9PAST|nr:MBOAT family O-acyltransferase [Actinobacillus delphinicola]VEJ08788.1 Predicted membrane protein [Actinobacillus delphinicola]